MSSKRTILGRTITPFLLVAILVGCSEKVETPPAPGKGPSAARDKVVIKGWKTVGGAGEPIHLYIRDPSSGTYLGFQELAMDKKPYATNNATRFTTYAEIAQAVGKDAKGIGYATIQLAAKPGVKPISVGGVP